MSRYRAAAIHFGLSAAIFVALAYVVVAVWYPGMFFRIDGGWQGMRILILVDLVLGPLLTLIVFKAGKPGLKVDLALIGAIQLSCLAAGTWIVKSERPIAVVYVDGYFFTMSKDSYTELGLQPPELSEIPGPSPKWVMVELPSDAVEQAELREDMWKKKRPLRTLTDRYVAFDASKLRDSEAYPLTQLQDQDREAKLIDAWLEKHGGTLADYEFFPIGTRYAFTFLGFDSNERKMLGLLGTPAPGLG
jgi:hypothetical protein